VQYLSRRPAAGRVGASLALRASVPRGVHRRLAATQRAVPGVPAAAVARRVARRVAAELRAVAAAGARARRRRAARDGGISSSPACCCTRCTALTSWPPSSL